MSDVLTCVSMNFSTGENHIDGIFEWCFSLDNAFWLATRWTLPTHCWWEYECNTRKGMVWNQCIDWTTFCGDLFLSFCVGLTMWFPYSWLMSWTARLWTFQQVSIGFVSLMFQPGKCIVMSNSSLTIFLLTRGWLVNHLKEKFNYTGPEPAFGRLGLGGSSGGYSSHGYTSHASLRAFNAQLGGNSCSSEDLQHIFIWFISNRASGQS